MNSGHRRGTTTLTLLLGSAMMLAGCGDRAFDWDLRSAAGGLNTAEAARMVTEPRPAPDSRGIISYPNYQVAVAKRGDTVASVASRLGLNAADLARYNAVKPEDPLRAGEVLALPRRVAEPSPATGAATTGPILPANQGISVSEIATSALDRADAGAKPAPGQTAPRGLSGDEPVRHQVRRGETAYSIARLYNVSAKALAEWNGLGADLAVREGQYLLIPLAAAQQPARVAAATPPGAGSPTPEPPSAAKPLPAEKPAPAATKPADTPASPDLGAQRTAASAARFAMPASGSIVRGYTKGKNDGIDIGAAAGSPVKAAADGVVAAITKDTEQVPIIVIRHADNLLTVYANIDGIKVSKGANVKKGQTIASVRAANPAFLHFEVRKGFDSVDPMPYLQ